MATPSNQKNSSVLSRFVRSVWLFPALLAALLILLTSFKISGTSIGIYHDVFYGKSKDPNLLLNHPQPIRSDEWLVTTQLTLAQAAVGYPRVNPNIDSGRDMSIVGDAPYKDWSSVLKPQNLAFLVLPLEYAFAFKWWLLLYLTIVSCYFLVLRFFSGRRLFAALMSTAVGCSPFLFWWYATGTFGPMFYGFFIMLLGVRIINDEELNLFGGRLSRYSRIIYAVTLGYLLSCFVLILYPPFQIPIALVVAAFLSGFYLNKYGLSKQLFAKPSLIKLGTFAVGVIIALIVVLSFVHTRANVIHSIRNTAYPGGIRMVAAGGYPIHELFSTFMQPQLQRFGHAANYYTNQSEASQFILLVPFLFLPGFVLLIKEYRSTRRINWPLLLVQLCITLFFLNLFVPGMHLLYKVLLLDQVQHGRIFIGLGFAGVLQLLLIVKSLEDLKIKRKVLDIHVGYYTLICLVVLAWSAQFTHDKWPIFASNALFIAFLGVFFAAIIFCFMSLRLLLAASLLLLFSLGSVFHVHPLYRGLGPYYNGALTKAIDKVSKSGDTWANLDNLVYENAPLISNRDSISGIKPYPDLKFWRQVEGPGSHNKNDYVYNRYAHVLFSSSTTMDDQLHLNGPDSFAVQFGCTPFVQKHVRYALSIHTLEYPCIAEVDEVHYPAVTFYLYKVY